MLLERQRLDEVLGVLSTSVGNRVMEVAKYVRFRMDPEAQKVIVSTTDFHSYLSMDFGDLTLANFNDVGPEFLIDFKSLRSIVTNSSTDTVELVDKDQSYVTVVTDGKYKFPKYQTPEEFPDVDYRHTVAVKWPVPTIQSAWNKASVAVSEDVTKINYQGVYFDGDFAATDNRRLAVVSGNDYEGNPMLIPPLFGEIIRHCKNEIEIGVNTDDNLIIIVCNQIGLIASLRLIDAQFVDHHRVIEGKKITTAAVVDKRQLLGAITRLSTFTDKQYKVVGMKLACNSDSAHQLELSIQHSGAGDESVNVVDIEVEDNDALADLLDSAGTVYLTDANFHLENLRDGIAATESSENVRLEFQGDGKLWVVEDTFQYLLSNITD